jgi:hypothetical protein
VFFLFFSEPKTPEKHENTENWIRQRIEGGSKRAGEKKRKRGWKIGAVSY